MKHHRRTGTLDPLALTDRIQRMARSEGSDVVSRFLRTTSRDQWRGNFTNDCSGFRVVRVRKRG